ncbi:ABC1 kinase family protein [Desulfosediminicola flagellatus]|uniref:ABC1 kinase family protein n=1 Tax=Desulfosediminicola flagellatus TaxID=2569541 RepID=UPI0010AC8957|nr:AarF/ABC1/UbiB kinase family protein [Desulfosediminicola flagellatus]
MKIGNIKQTIRNTKRLAEIIKVLSKFGFQQVILDTGIHRLLDIVKEEIDIDIAPSAANKPRAVRFRLVLEELGPTFIKIGQVLSTRPDLIPPAWADELKKLQDRCSNVPFEDIRTVLLQEFPEGVGTLFAHIDEQPMAAASLAQVHRAKLKDGTEVVIKVLRPGSRKMVEEDMSLLKGLAQLVEQYFSDLGYSPNAVAKEFSRELLKEINLIHEGQSTDRLRRYFKSDTTVYFPKVYWQSTTRNVLTLEEIKGRLLSTLSPDDLTPLERRAIVARGTDAVFAQCLQYGFFHADPHPGNIILKHDNSICFIDCGMTGQLDRLTTEHLIDLVAGVIKADIDKLCRVVIELTETDPAITDRRDFRTDLQHLISHFQQTNLENLDIAFLLSEFFGMLQRYKIQCPGDLVLLTKALTTIEGVAEQFDPTFDVLSHVEPRIQEVVMGRYGYNAIRNRMQKTVMGYLELFEDLPADFQRFLGYFRHSRFTLNLELKRLEHLADKIDLSSRIMGMAMIISALIVGSSILILADSMSTEHGVFGTLGTVGLILAGINAAGFVASFLLPRKKK